jgi:hypothetical protein
MRHEVLLGLQHAEAGYVGDSLVLGITVLFNHGKDILRCLRSISLDLFPFAM